MNEDNQKSQNTTASIPANTTATTTPPSTPEYKPKVPVPKATERSIKPLRTFEMDMATAPGGKGKNIKKIEDKPAPTIETPPTAKGSNFIFEKAVSMTEARQKNAPNYEGVPVQAEEVAPTGFAIPEIEDHPLHVLHNQTDSPRPFVYAFSQFKKPETTPFKTPQNTRTYENDIAKVAQDPKTSILSMAIAESERRAGTKSLSSIITPDHSKKIFFAILSLLFIVAGSLGGYYFYKKSVLATVPIVQELGSSKILKSDESKVIKVGVLDNTKIFAQLSEAFISTPIGPEVLMEFFPTITIASSTRIMNGVDFINLFQFKVTDALKRSILNDWMIGIYTPNDSNIPFVIITTDFFQNAFAGMYKWEATMARDFAELFNYKERLSSGRFEDRVVINRDIREFKNSSGEVLLLYSFIDKNTILITTSEAVIPELIKRIEKQTYVR